jgi:aminomethyltransferase
MIDEGALNDLWPVVEGEQRIGRVTAGAWSPRLEKNIGYAWVPSTHMDEGTSLTLRSSSGTLPATVAALPFFDPAKRVPVA